MKIGFLDSGLGGLTILNKAIKEIKADYIFFADTKNSPYGTKEKNKVGDYIFKGVENLIELGCKIIVIACNTATLIAIEDLRIKYSDICFIGTEPAVKRAVDLKSDDKKILVCGTSTTIKEERLKHLINNLEAVQNVDLVALDKLVSIAEHNILDTDLASDYLKKQFETYNLGEYSYVVLGCTHFPLFNKEFKEVFGNNTQIIDGSQGVVNRLKSKLASVYGQNYIEAKEANVKLLLSKENSNFVNSFKNILNLSEIKVVTLE